MQKQASGMVFVVFVKHYLNLLLLKRFFWQL